MAEQKYEYGIDYAQDALKYKGGSIHRGPMSREDAILWIAEWLEMGGKPGIFKMIRRPVYDWEDADYSTDELADAVDKARLGH